MKICCPEEIAYNMGYIYAIPGQRLGPIFEEERLRYLSGSPRGGIVTDQYR